MFVEVQSEMAAPIQANYNLYLLSVALKRYFMSIPCTAGITEATQNPLQLSIKWWSISHYCTVKDTTNPEI